MGCINWLGGRVVELFGWLWDGYGMGMGWGYVSFLLIVDSQHDVPCVIRMI